MSSNLMEKLAISKAIMDKHNNMARGTTGSENINIPQTPQLETFNTPNPNYNIPQEFLSETQTKISNPQVATKDKILGSKLPNEIKKLMIENPIVPINPMSPSSSVLSDELVEKASRLMGTKKEQPIQQSSSSNNTDMRSMIKEVVQEVLKENGLLLESTSKTNETVVIKVGQHIFEGKISKIKKTK